MRNDVNYEILIQRVRTNLLQVVKEMSEIVHMMLMQQLMYLWIEVEIEVSEFNLRLLERILKDQVSGVFLDW